MICDIPAAAAATAGLRLAAWAILHALDDIEQSHVCLLNVPAFDFICGRDETLASPSDGLPKRRP